MLYKSDVIQSYLTHIIVRIISFITLLYVVSSYCTLYQVEPNFQNGQFESQRTLNRVTAGSPSCVPAVLLLPDSLLSQNDLVGRSLYQLLVYGI